MHAIAVQIFSNILHWNADNFDTIDVVTDGFSLLKEQQLHATNNPGAS